MIEVIGILILLVLFTIAAVNIIAPASDWKLLREVENDLMEDNVNTDEYIICLQLRPTKKHLCKDLSKYLWTTKLN